MRRMLVVLVVGLLLCSAASANAASPSLGLDVLSNRADVISAGEALVEVKIPAGVSVSKVRVYDDGRDVTSAFALRQNGRFEGLVTGLALGRNMLTAKAQGARDATVTVTNHPNGGPVFSGPQVQPWVCQAARPTRSATSRRATSTATSRPRARSATTTPPTRRPTSRRRRPTRARRSRTSSASRPATRTATSTGSPSSTTRPSRGRLGAAEAVEPQAADHPRRELRDRAPGRHRRPDVR